jgi:LemA protein
VRIEQFPDLIVARMFHFPPQTMLRFETADLQDVNIAKQFA